MNVLAAYNKRISLFRKHGYDIAKARDFIIRKAGLLTASGPILEFATGSGHMAIALAKRDIKCVSFDSDGDALRTAGSNLRNMGLSRFVSLKRMDAGNVPYKDDSFDTVVSVNFIHHTDDAAGCVSEMVRIARSKVVIADFNKRGFMTADKVHRSEGGRHERSASTMDEVKKLLARSGMEVKVYRDKCQTVLVSTKRRKK
ncbi:MAG: class I SAM-dependent methyltransferase [Candidatus Omnitrophota bacterium]